jgi:hypothetical protein
MKDSGKAWRDVMSRALVQIETNDPGAVEVIADMRATLADYNPAQWGNHTRPLMVRVIVGDASGEKVIADFLMDHNDAMQRRVLGEQSRYAFLAGQSVFTNPVGG